MSAHVHDEKTRKKQRVIILRNDGVRTGAPRTEQDEGYLRLRERVRVAKKTAREVTLMVNVGR